MIATQSNRPAAPRAAQRWPAGHGRAMSDLGDRCPVQRADLGRTILIETRTEARNLFWGLLVLADGAAVSVILARQIARRPGQPPDGQSSLRRMVATDNASGDRARFREIGQASVERRTVMNWFGSLVVGSSRTNRMNGLRRGRLPLRCPAAPSSDPRPGTPGPPADHRRSSPGTPASSQPPRHSPSGREGGAGWRRPGIAGSGYLDRLRDQRAAKRERDRAIAELLTATVELITGVQAARAACQQQQVGTGLTSAT